AESYTMSSFLPRQVPPTATPMSFSEWESGIRPSATSLDDFAMAMGAYLETPYLFFASSGRTALRLLLDTAAKQRQWGGRTQVVLPGYTCPALAKVILDSGLT